MTAGPYTPHRGTMAVLALAMLATISSDPAAAPSVTWGAGAPSASEADGSVYIRTDGAADTTLYVRASSAWVAIEGAGGSGTFTTLTATGLSTLTSLAGATATELTIAGGVITRTQLVHTVDTEADAASDDLDTISGGSGELLLIVRPASDARSVVLKHGTGNIECPGGVDVTLAEDDDYALLVWNGTKWAVLAHKSRSDTAAFASVTATTADINGGTLDGAVVGGSSAAAGTFTALTSTTEVHAAATELTIAAGVITVTQSWHTVDTEADAASDDLDTISGGAHGWELVVMPADDARTVVIKHNVGNIKCEGSADITLATDTDMARLRKVGSVWIAWAKATAA